MVSSALLCEIRTAIGEDYPGVRLPLRQVDRSGAAPAIEQGWPPIAEVRLTDHSGLALSLLALSGLVGCGEVYLGEREWACTNQASEYRVTELLRRDDRLWRFPSSEKLGAEVNGHAALSISRLDGSIPSNGQMIRVGGEGDALITDEFEPPSVEITLGAAVTYALWISPPQAWLQGERNTLILLSSMNDGDSGRTDCGGHALALQKTAGDGGEIVKVSLVLTYFDPNCNEQSRTAELALRDSNQNRERLGLLTSDAWGLGKWYHVAVSIAPRDSQTSPSAAIDLFWDGSEVYSTEFDAKMSGDLRTVLRIGGDQHNSNRFTGNIDDVALFQRALDRKEIDTLRLDSLAKYGMAGLRWATWDVARSTASWGLRQSTGLEVTCQDGASGGCGASALVDWGTRLSALDHIVLSADLPQGKTTDVVLSDGGSGRQFCKWTVEGVGGADYKLSVKNQVPDPEESNSFDSGGINELKWCKCDTCDCGFDVKAVSVGSEWTPQVGNFPCLMCGVQPYKTGSDAGAEYKWSRGAVGPHGWCWRPIAYDIASHAYFTSAPDPSAAVRAKLSGPQSTTAQLAADLGTGSLRMDSASKIVFCASLPKDEQFQIILRSANDGYCQYQVRGKAGDINSFDRYPDEPITLEYCKQYIDENNRSQGEDGQLLKFDPSRVRYLGIQKTWAVDGASEIAIDSVSLSGSDFECPQLVPPKVF